MKSSSSSAWVRSMYCVWSIWNYVAKWQCCTELLEAGTVCDLSGTMLRNDNAVPNLSALNYLVQNADIWKSGLHTQLSLFSKHVSNYDIHISHLTMLWDCTITLRRHQHFHNWTGPVSNVKVGGLSITLYRGDDDPKMCHRPLNWLIKLGDLSFSQQYCCYIMLCCLVGKSQCFKGS